ncbi:MAG: 5'-nucleotidase C-terminal domain-containing protein, partial [Bacilli bacterium]
NSVGTNYDPVVEEIIDNAYAEDEATLTEAYSVAGETVSSKYDLCDWTANVMRASVGADIAISNYGGLRSDGDIYVGDDITLVTMYEITPFDNFIMVVEVPGSVIKTFWDSNKSSLYYTMDDSIPDITSINSSTIYKVAIIDYVYYWGPLDTYETINSGLIFRNMLIEDLKLRDKFYPKTSPDALITNQLD